MKLFTRTRAYVGGVLVFAAALTTTAVFAGNSDTCQAQEGVHLTAGISAAMADSTESLDTEQEQETMHLTAGISAALDASDIVPLTLTAGITDVLMDTSTVDIADTDTYAVTASLGDSESEDSAEDDADFDSVTDESICGYENLGIASVDGNLNVRKEASTSSTVVGKMTNHNACEIEGEEDGWYQIKSGKVSGYVKADYIITGDEAKEIAEDEIITVATVNATTLRVRKSASTDSGILALVGDGEDLVVDEELDGWYAVEVDNETGYVSADYVTVSQKLATATSVNDISGTSSTRSSLVSYALQFVGNRYVYGGTSLTNGIDCSGFTMKIYAKYGISLPHHAASQPAYGKKISASEAKPGDLFFYGSGGSITHVGIYIGNGQIVHASNARTGIKISSAYYRTPICVVSYLS